MTLSSSESANSSVAEEVNLVKNVLEGVVKEVDSKEVLRAEKR
jgi:hypothetical protein